MKDLISVIVPVYNIEKYIGRCIESIVNQTYNKLEIILVDDGSTDNSGIICDKYAKKDKRIKVIHKSNAGVSEARNIGINLSEGEYIGFVDGDDIIEPFMYEILLKNLKVNKSNISCCQIQTENLDGTISKPEFKKSTAYSKNEIVNGFFFDEFIKGFIVSPCNKIILSEIIKKNKIRFKPYSMAEDFLFIFEVLTKVDRVYYDSTIGYHYMHRENSAMTSTFSTQRFEYIDAIKEIGNIAGAKYNSEIANKANTWIYMHVLVTYRSLIMNNLIKKYADIAKEYKIFIKNNKKYLKKLCFKRKIDYIFCIYFPFIYKLVVLNK